jgi:hypothetical protein
MNPLRRVIWKLCRPYFESLVLELDRLDAAELGRREIANLSDAKIVQLSREMRRTTDALAHRLKLFEAIIEEIDARTKKVGS